MEQHGPAPTSTLAQAVCNSMLAQAVCGSTLAHSSLQLAPGLFALVQLMHSLGHRVPRFLGPGRVAGRAARQTRHCMPHVGLCRRQSARWPLTGLPHNRHSLAHKDTPRLGALETFIRHVRTAGKRSCSHIWGEHARTAQPASRARMGGKLPPGECSGIGRPSTSAPPPLSLLRLLAPVAVFPGPATPTPLRTKPAKTFAPPEIPRSWRQVLARRSLHLAGSRKCAAQARVAAAASMTSSHMHTMRTMAGILAQAAGIFMQLPEITASRENMPRSGSFRCA